MEEFKKYGTETSTDRFGNIYFRKKGRQSNYSIMVAAHLDEIGLMVKYIDSRGYLRFTTVGGIDPRTLPAQEVYVHGRETLLGIIGSIPPHIQHEKSEKAMKIDDLAIDVGLPYDKVIALVQVGDPVTIKRECVSLLNDLVAGKALDDRAGIVVMLQCLLELQKLYHAHDVIFVATSQEEVGIRGAITSAYTINPDIGIAVDVTHAVTPDTKGQVNIELKKGPTIALGPNIHPKIYDHLIKTAKENRIPHQIEPIPGASGTDAWAIQVTRSGIPTGLVSIPLRYMHTSVETVSMQDITNAGSLLAYFIASLPDDLEEFLCC